MKVTEMRQLSVEALDKELLDRRREQFNLRMQSASGQGVRPDQIAKVRKDIARLKTIMRERAVTEEGQGQ
jgi:large subunit ribosomal protein L29